MSASFDATRDPRPLTLDAFRAAARAVFDRTGEAPDRLVVSLGQWRSGVGVAAGRFLDDLVAGARPCVSRLPGETDDELRERVLWSRVEAN